MCSRVYLWPAVDYIFTNFSVDSSGRFPFTLRTNTDGHPTHTLADSTGTTTTTTTTTTVLRSYGFCLGLPG